MYGLNSECCGGIIPSDLSVCITDVRPLGSFRGRVIPADLEAKIIDAKQKVGVLLILAVGLCLHMFFSSHLLINHACPLTMAGLRAVVRQRHGWFHGVRRVRPHQRDRRHLREVQPVAPCRCERAGLPSAQPPLCVAPSRLATRTLSTSVQPYVNATFSAGSVGRRTPDVQEASS